MIDKIKLHCDIHNFYIKPNTDISILPTKYSFKTGELELEYMLFHTNKEHSDSPVKGSKAYFLPDTLELPLQITINGFGLWIEYNPSKIFFKKNEFYSVTNKQNDIVSELIKTELLRLGVIVDLDKMKLSRLDLCRDIELKEYFNLYSQALTLITKPRTIDKKIDSSIMFQNKSWAIVFYDKIKEMNSRGIEISPDYNIKGDILRCEIRFKKASVIQKKLSIHSLKNLSEYYPELKLLYSEFIDELFSGANIKANSEITNVKELIDNMKKKSQRNIPFKAMSLYGLQHRFETGQLPLFFEGLEEAGYSPNHVNKVKREFRQLLNLVPSSSSEFSVSELLAELQEKLVLN